MSDATTMEELLHDAPSNWGKWGDDDEVGALNYLTAEEVLRGVAHVTSGKVFALQRLIGDPNGDPVWPGRTPAERTQVLDEFNCDGYDARTTVGSLDKASVAPIAERGVVGRGVYTFLYAAAPLKVNRASGSPVNPLAIK